MDRRKFLAFSTAGAAAMMSRNAIAQHNHMTHSKDKTYSKWETQLSKTAVDCINDGKLCLAHCLESMSSGDKTLARCQQSVVNMLASVEAMNNVAIYGNYKKSSMIKLVDACQSFCEDCFAECKKHSKHHATCKSCGIMVDCIKPVKFKKHICAGR